VLQFLSRVSVSVLLVSTAGGRARPLLGQTGFTRVLVPMDGSRRSEWALTAARQLMRGGDAALTLVHVAPVPELPHSDLPLAPEEIALQGRVTERNLHAVQARMNAVSRELAQHDIEVTGFVESDPDPAGRLLAVIEEEDPELVMVCAHGCGARATATGGPFGHVASFLMTHAHRPILVLQDDVDTGAEGGHSARHGTTFPTTAAADFRTQAR
jgi:nucleotide-binding universal stress UspA family protein